MERGSDMLIVFWGRLHYVLAMHNGSFVVSEGLDQEDDAEHLSTHETLAEAMLAAAVACGVRKGTR